jgi:uncharacterized membrane protein
MAMPLDPILLRKFPVAAGILFGLGLGGFVDGIVLHQLLQWHHMLSSWYPTNTVENLKLNTTWDGIFHTGTYLFVVAGLFTLWQSAHRRHLYWSNKMLIGTLLLGWGFFNFVEGIIDHEVLGVHHVNEIVAQSQQIYWDTGFLVWGIAMIAAGWAMVRTGRQKAAYVERSL